MLHRLFLPALAALALAPLSLAAGPAMAQSTDTSNPQDLPDKIRDKLTEQGFTEVKIRPGSYLVSAKDRNGTPVIMVIGPDSTTLITMAPRPSPSDERALSPGEGSDKILQQ